MALLGKVGGAVQGVVAKSPLGGLVGGANANYGGPEQEQQRALMAQQAAFQQRLAGQAADYRANLGDTRAKEYALAGNQRRQDLQGQMQDINRGASSRGLLYSGLRQNAATGAQVGAAKNIASDREKINQQTEAKAQEMEANAVGMGLQNQAQQQGMQGDLYNRALAQRRDKLAAREALFKSAGSIGGMAAGSGGSGGAGSAGGSGVYA